MKIEPNPNDPKAVKDDVKAKSKLILLVDPILYVHIQQAENAKQLWDNLTKAFEDRGLTRKVGLLKDLINTTLETSESVESYVNKIMSSAHKLRNINFNVDDEWLGTLMLAGLPDSYKPMIMGIESSGVKISADLIKTKLLQEVKSIDSDTTVLYTKHNNVKDPQNNPKKDGVKLIQNKNQMVCELCQKGKQSRLPFPSEGSRALNPLELIHSDVCGPMEVKSLGGARSILKFKEYKALVENQLNFKIKCLRSDNGREYLSNDFSNYLKKSGIIHQTSNSYTPQQNGLAERMNRTLMERARCMLINSDLQKSYWAEAVSTAAYITNRCPTRALSYATPEEMWSGKKPDVSHLKIFGCEAMVKIPKRSFENWILRQAK
ncbi:Retrovirus-related Pol polyprotein from transposon TNT 1-94 [Eumeta japonica]|uniref:Retrovirus-related Pol polyprotein from transposon TNT 1-94 n=1 Tax=Eumeta variegata TaxID=151549 RepID=A0A4C1UH14_EUMVA|nr:Retrovirus-related Pol polyprotein from transposon TNT 1-94 [Eumeta japonica]